jgi:hypothetical protein
MGKGVRHCRQLNGVNSYSWSRPAPRQTCFSSPRSRALESLDDLIFFDLKPGTTQETAYEIASYLNEHIAMIGLLRFAPGD